MTDASAVTLLQPGSILLFTPASGGMQLDLHWLKKDDKGGNKVHVSSPNRMLSECTRLQPHSPLLHVAIRAAYRGWRPSSRWTPRR